MKASTFLKIAAQAEAQKAKREAAKLERRKYDAYDTPLVAADNIARKYPND